MSLIKELLPMMGPALIGVGGLVLGSAFVTTRRLRLDLRADTELLTRLTPTTIEHTELDSAIRTRTLQLVAATRYPALKSLDIVCWLIVFLAASAAATCHFLLMTLPEPVVEQVPAVFAIVLLPGVGLVALAAFRILWRKRMRSRLDYIKAHLDPEEVGDSKRTLQVADVMWSCVGILLVGVSGSQLIMSTGIVYRWPIWLVVALASAYPVVAGLLLRTMTRFIESDEWQQMLAETQERWAAQAVEKAGAAGTQGGSLTQGTYKR